MVQENTSQDASNVEKFASRVTSPVTISTDQRLLGRIASDTSSATQQRSTKSRNYHIKTTWSTILTFLGSPNNTKVKALRYAVWTKN